MYLAGLGIDLFVACAWVSC